MDQNFFPLNGFYTIVSPKNDFPQHDSPLGNSVFNEGGEYLCQINFPLLLEDIKKFRDISFDLDASKYVSNIEIPALRKNTIIYEILDFLKNAVPSEIGESISNLLTPDVPILDAETKNIAKIKGAINKKKGVVPLKGNVEFKFVFDPSKKLLYFSDIFRYADSNEIAMVITATNFWSYKVLCDHEGLYLKPSRLKEIENRFMEELKNAGNDPNQLDYWYQSVPEFVLGKLSALKIGTDLRTLLSVAVDQWGTDEEALILRILSEMSKRPNDINQFLTNLTIIENGETAIEKLMSKMNDFGGEDNYTMCVKLIVKLWSQSYFSNPDTYKDYFGPQVLPYVSKKIIGFYTDDFKFSFSSGNILIDKEYDVLEGELVNTRTEFVASYDIFQPIYIPSIAQKGEISFPDRKIPAFYLKAFDDKNAWANLEKSSWLAVDMATTASGVGNLLKLRYLVTASRTLKVIMVASGILQLSSGVLGTMLNFVDEQNSPFAEKLRKYLFWLDIATFSVDVFTNRMLVKTAKESLEELPHDVKKNHPEIGAHLTQATDMAGTGGSFKYLKEVESMKIFGQEQPMSCSAACIRQLAKDNGIDLSEEIIRDWAKTSGFDDGTLLENIGPTLQRIFPKKEIIAGSPNFGNSSKESAMILSNTKKSWIASIKPPGKMRHTIIVDKISNGKVYIRDPWSKLNGYGDQNGVEAIMYLDDFLYFWKNSYNHFVHIN